MKTLEVRKKIEILLCAAVGIASHRHGSEAYSVYGRSSKPRLHDVSIACKDGCSIGGMHERGIIFCNPFLG
jgi:hypothetical protein